MNILDRIVANKRKEIAERKLLVPAKKLEEFPLFAPDRISLAENILDKSGSGIIAEFKRRSPSAGLINGQAEPDRVVAGYFRYGASGASVLTDKMFFGGDCGDLSAARKACYGPILRKDFIIDEYQVIESRATGADAIILIAAILDKRNVSSLGKLARQLGLEVLLEIRSLSETGMIDCSTSIIGVNNRNLGTFETDVNTSGNMIEHLPAESIKISESGISSPEAIRKLKAMGYNGFLIGETFMREADPALAFLNFVKSI
ncbi:MAG: indole-3-glycerol phosphate synthase TrpC [Bacteroidales bacterium]